MSAEVDQTFLNVLAKNLVKVARIGKVMGKKKPPTLRELSSGSTIKIVFSKHVVLIMPIIIRIIINMDGIGQERLSEGPILSLNKRLK